MKNNAFFLLICFFVIHQVRLNGQFNWQHTNGPDGGTEWGIWHNEQYAFYADEYFLYRTNDGLSWEKFPESAIWPLATHNNDLVGQFHADNLLAYEQQAKLKVSHDNGATWLDGTFPTGVTSTTKMAYCAHGIYLSEPSEQQIYRSQDDGLTWDSVLLPGLTAYRLQAFEERVYLDNSKKVMRSDTNGINWALISPALASGEYILGVTARDVHLLISTSERLWYSKDDGQTWAFQNTSGSFKFDAFIWIGDTIYGNGGETSLARSEDFGATWTMLPPGSLYLNQFGLAKAGGKPLVTTYNRGIFRWEEATQSFQNANNGLHSASVSGLASGKNVLWANTPNGVFRYDRQQQKWDSIPSVIETEKGFKTLVSNDSDLVCVVHQGKNFIYYSKDGGVHWDSIYPPKDPDGVVFPIEGMKVFDHEVYLAADFYNWSRTSDFGQSWNALPQDIADFVKFKDNYIGRDWQGQLFNSVDQGLHWVAQPGSIPGKFINFFLADDLLFATVSPQNGDNGYSRIYASDDGIHWKYAHDGLPNRHYGYDFDTGAHADFFGYHGQYFMFHTELGFYTSLDTAKTWVPVAPYSSWNMAMADSLFYSPVSGGVVQSGLPTVFGVLAEGTVFMDDNDNGVKESNEAPLDNIQVGLSAPDAWFSFYMTNTKSDGTYALGVTPSLQDTLRPFLSSSYIEHINPPNRIVGNGGDGLDFGIKLMPGIQDLAIAGNYLGSPRPGKQLDIVLYYSNAGTLPSDETVSIKLDNHLNYLHATPPPNAIFGDSLVWSFAQMPLFSNGKIFVTTNVPGNTPLSTLITSNCYILSPNLDINLSNNLRILSDTVKNAFDPNVKKVEPADGLTHEEISAGKEILYTIQFQNTGNYPADQVRITDLLDTALYYPSCRLVVASHEVTSFRLMPGGLLEMIFDNIQLSDSNSNEIASHGFVTFGIQRKKAHDNYYVVRNEAAIYFDSNEPVLTNLVTTPIKTLSVSTQTPYQANFPDALRIYPNPAYQNITISTEGKFIGLGLLTIQNTSGQVCSQFYVTDSSRPIEVNVTGLPNGLYLIRLNGADMSAAGSFILYHN